MVIQMREQLTRLVKRSGAERAPLKKRYPGAGCKEYEQKTAVAKS